MDLLKQFKNKLIKIEDKDITILQYINGVFNKHTNNIIKLYDSKLNSIEYSGNYLVVLIYILYVLVKDKKDLSYDTITSNMRSLVDLCKNSKNVYTYDSCKYVRDNIKLLAIDLEFKHDEMKDIFINIISVIIIRISWYISKLAYSLLLNKSDKINIMDNYILHSAILGIDTEYNLIPKDMDIFYNLSNKE